MMGTCAHTCEMLQIPVAYSVIFAAGMTTYAFVQFGPVYAFFLLYGDISCSLMAWAKNLTERIEIQRINKVSHTGSIIAESLKECKRFVTALQKTCDKFSGHIFCVTNTILFGIICTTYRAIAFFIGTQVVHTPWILVSLIFGYLALSCVLWMQVLYMGLTADKVKEEVKGLLQEVVALQWKENEITVTMNGNPKAPSFIIDKLEQSKSILIFQLSEFEGYPARGFYVMNKSTLSSLFSNFVTYLIISLQFRTGEEN